MKIMLFNGPPGCGKDTAAKAIYHQPGIPCTFERMSYPNKAAFAGMMRLPMNEFFEVDPWEKQKEAIVPQLGVSFRKWQIDFSEKFMKPLYGQDVFGRLLVERLDRRSELCDHGHLFVIPDCGFLIEATSLLQSFRPRDILLVKIYRAGKTFNGDSRSYISADCETISVFNNGDQAVFEDAIIKLAKEFTNG